MDYLKKTNSLIFRRLLLPILNFLAWQCFTWWVDCLLCVLSWLLIWCVCVYSLFCLSLRVYWLVCVCVFTCLASRNDYSVCSDLIVMMVWLFSVCIHLFNMRVWLVDLFARIVDCSFWVVSCLPFWVVRLVLKEHDCGWLIPQYADKEWIF
jgi:hypothetical protein